jgi:hypothetical protein
VIGPSDREVVDVYTKSGILAVMAVLIMLTAGMFPLTGAFSSRGAVPNTDSEPNNTLADATIVNTGGTIKGTEIGTDHSDNYKFQLSITAGNAQKAYLDVTVDDPNPLVSFYLRDANGFLLAFHRDISNAKLFAVASSTSSAWYYFNITDDSELGLTYNVTVSFSVEAFMGDVNNNPSEAVAIGAFPYAVNSTLQGGLDPMDAQDFYKVSLSRTVSKADLLITQLKQSLTAQYWVEVYDSAFKDVAGYEHQGEPKPGLTQTYSYGTQAPGLYYIRVWAANGTGSYDLSVDRIEIDLNDNNDKPSNATAINLLANHTASLLGNLGEGLDLFDYYSLTVVKGQFLNASITSLEYNQSTGLPKMHLTFLKSDGTTMYTIDPNMTHDQLNPLGFTNGTATETGPVTNYIKVFVDNLASGGGRYMVSLLTDRPPVANQSLVGSITINESTTDKPTSDSSIKLGTLFHEPDGNDKVTFSYSILSDQGMADPLNLSVAIAKDADMTVTMSPRPGTTGTQGYRGEGTITFASEDNYGLKATATFHVKVTGTNHAPYVKAPYNATYSFKEPLNVLYNETGLIEVDLTKVFEDIDLNDRLLYEVNGSSSKVEKKTYGTNAVDQYSFIKSATINDTFILGFDLKQSLVEHTGVVTVRLNADSTKVKQAKEDRQPLEETVWFQVYDNGVIPKWSDHSVKLVLRAMSPNGTAPKWTQSLTKIAFNEDSNVTMDFDTATSDIDPDDAAARTYTVGATGPNITVQKLDRNHFKFWAKPDWTGIVKDLVLNCTDTFGLYKTHMVDIVVTNVQDRPVKDTTTPVEGTTIHLNEGASLELGIKVHDVDLDILKGLDYNWSLDGSWLRTNVGPNFTYQPSYDEAGTHAIMVLVSDRNYPSLNVSANWTLIIDNVNRPPTGLQIVSPDPGATYKKGQVVPLMAAKATDPDKEDTVKYSWKVDGQVVASTQTFNLQGLKKGAHTITLEISDGKVTVPLSVNITIKAATTGQSINLVYVALGVVALIVVLAVLALALRPKNAAPDEKEEEAEEKPSKGKTVKEAPKPKKTKEPEEEKQEPEEAIEDEEEDGA